MPESLHSILDDPAADIRPISAVPFILKWGLVAAFINIAWSLIMQWYSENPFQYNWWETLLSMALIIAVMYLAGANYRKARGGKIDYAGALGVSFFTALTGLIFGYILIYIYWTYIIDFTTLTNRYAAAVLREYAGADRETMQNIVYLSIKQMTPLRLLLYSFIFAVIADFIAALVLSVFLKRKTPY